MIHTGDCVEVMAGMEPESVDAIVTDPPYDLLTTSRNGSRRINNPDTPAGRSARGFMGKTWDGTGVAFRPETWVGALRVAKPGAYLLAFGGTRTVHRMTTAIEDAGWEIRDCLVWGYASGFPKSKFMGSVGRGDPTLQNGERSSDAGRWPANVILTDPIFDGDTPGVVGGGETQRSAPASGPTWEGPSGSPSRSPFNGMGEREPQFYGDAGTYSRFFLVPKADRSDREPIIYTEPDTSQRDAGDGQSLAAASQNAGPRPQHVRRANSHPTVKPTELMRHLVRLVTPTGGLVLDPFLGSGTTAIACELEGFRWIGIEKEPEYVAIAEARLNGTQRGLGLSA